MKIKKLDVLLLPDMKHMSFPKTCPLFWTTTIISNDHESQIFWLNPLLERRTDDIIVVELVSIVEEEA